MTLFEQRVYRAVRDIPRGEVRTYKEVASVIGHPEAVRAVGNALSNNRDPKIPCHRVVRSDGTIGGYNRGTKQKTKLLRKEGVVVDSVAKKIFM
jgi:methylated-DNA-[protein]-cysteine S-methyltransferase